MSTPTRTVTTLRAQALFVSVQHTELQQIEQGETIVDRLETQEQVDRRSDAYFYRAFQLADVIEQAPEHAVEYARLIKEAIRYGLALDSIEDEHREAASASATTIQDLGRGVVARLAAVWNGGVA